VFLPEFEHIQYIKHIPQVQQAKRERLKFKGLGLCCGTGQSLLLVAMMLQIPPSSQDILQQWPYIEKKHRKIKQTVIRDMMTCTLTTAWDKGLGEAGREKGYSKKGKSIL
jgi:hypothetical protein